jgi:AcrR family transcriptional regulator
MDEPKRQQADRTAATRKAVLEATVELLAERGYAGTSTRLAAERAGVSLGALQHHFRTKADLSVEALRYASRRLAREFVAAAPVEGDAEERFATILDRLFVVFRGSTFAAAVEIHLAARTDADLQQAAEELNRDVEDLIRTSAREILPDMIYHPDFQALMQVSLSAVRGLALTSMTPGRDRSEQWTQVRGQLLSLAANVARQEPV